MQSSDRVVSLHCRLCRALIHKPSLSRLAAVHPKQQSSVLVKNISTAPGCCQHVFIEEEDARRIFANSVDFTLDSGTV